MGSLSSNNTKVCILNTLHRLILREIAFDVKSIFAPAVKKWLEVTDSNTVEWVERAVRGDSFKADNDEMKQSSLSWICSKLLVEPSNFSRNCNGRMSNRMQ